MSLNVHTIFLIGVLKSFELDNLMRILADVLFYYLLNELTDDLTVMFNIIVKQLYQKKNCSFLLIMKSKYIYQLKTK